MYNREYKKFIKLKEAAVRKIVLKGVPLEEARDKINALVIFYKNDYNDILSALKEFLNS